MAALCVVQASASAFEISAVRTQGISDQGDYPYCSFYAVASFLEIWGNSNRKPGDRLPPLDPAFLALSANLESSNNAFWMDLLLVVTAKHGIIPKGATATKKELGWPYPEWEAAHQELIEETKLRSITSAKYQHHSLPQPFTGADYLRQQIQIPLEKFRWVRSNYQEPSLLEFFDSSENEAPIVEASEPKEIEKTQKPKFQYRQGSYKKSIQALKKEAKKLKISVAPIWMDYSDLYDSILSQLYDKRPVLLSINTTFVSGDFANYALIHTGKLVDYGFSLPAKHAVVAIAHCDKTDSKDKVCARFNKSLEEADIDECIAIQNSWGEDSNSKGIVCISWGALEPILNSAILQDKNIKKD